MMYAKLQILFNSYNLVSTVYVCSDGTCQLILTDLITKYLLNYSKHHPNLMTISFASCLSLDNFSLPQFAHRDRCDCHPA